MGARLREDSGRTSGRHEVWVRKGVGGGGRGVCAERWGLRYASSGGFTIDQFTKYHDAMLFD